ncbi:MAG TPA: C1 family peptidase [Opitutus sp.]|nr:C1 family peptidase [Opitutus sp.]
MRFGRPIVLLALGLVFGWAQPLPAIEPPIGPGTKLDSFTVRATTYHHVQIRSVNAHTVFFTHDGGFSSVHLRDLTPEWQARFHYDPAADASPSPAPLVHRLVRVGSTTAAHPPDSGIERLLRDFGKPAELKSEVDLRPKFFALELDVKNQGRSPSCAIYAVVSAFEFQNAEITGTAQKFSGEYLLWAARQTIQRVLPATSGPGTFVDDADAGFTLGEVVDALRAYGIPLQSALPPTFAGMDPAAEPPPEVIARARTHRSAFVHGIPGRDNATRLNNIVHALNAGVPVPVGIGWPPYGTIRGGYISEQIPIGGHAVTLVGYRAPDHQLEHAVFLFKNSWGVAWGQGGYGLVTYEYLERNLDDAVLLELQPGGA